MWKQKDTKPSRKQPLSGNFLAVQGLGFCTCISGGWSIGSYDDGKYLIGRNQSSIWHQH